MNHSQLNAETAVGLSLPGRQRRRGPIDHNEQRQVEGQRISEPLCGRDEAGGAGEIGVATSPNNSHVERGIELENVAFKGMHARNTVLHQRRITRVGYQVTSVMVMDFRQYELSCVKRTREINSRPLLV